MSTVLQYPTPISTTTGFRAARARMNSVPREDTKT